MRFPILSAVKLKGDVRLSATEMRDRPTYHKDQRGLVIGEAIKPDGEALVLAQWSGFKNDEAWYPESELETATLFA